MINSSNFCLETNRQVNQCSGCENCSRLLKENKTTDALSMIGLYAAEANTYYLYSQAWFHSGEQNKK